MSARHGLSSAVSTVTAAILLALCAGLAHAEVEASLDLRLVDSDGRNGYLDGGFGKLRFDSGDQGLQLGRARLAWRGGIGGDWHASVDVSAWNVHDKNAIDLTEALIEWRPVPGSAWRSIVKIGAFFPPISLEHRAPGWSNPYTISSSALNTWVGEELRTIGVAYELEHLGIAEGGRVDFGLNAAVFGWNDPAGVELALRGFSLNDRQTPVFGRIGTYAFGGREQRVIFSEVDGRPGYHVGAYVKTDTGLEVRALHYDNRGNRAVFKNSIDDFAWDTTFDSVGLRYDAPGGLTFIAQKLKGVTYAGPDLFGCWTFDTWFVLAAHRFGRHRFAVRYDDFSVLQTTEHSPPPWSRDVGHALTIGWTYALRANMELAAEWLRIESLHSTRAALGESPRAVEHSAQLSVKFLL
jgi:hypothetical protein